MGNKSSSNTQTYGSEALDKTVTKLRETKDPRKRYEYVIWLGKKLAPMAPELQKKEFQVKGCISQVFVFGEMIEGRIQWRGDSDALITKGLLALLIQGLSNLTPKEVMQINPEFIAATGLHSSLTPSRANGFLNILLSMQAQASRLSKAESLITS